MDNVWRMALVNLGRVIVVFDDIRMDGFDADVFIGGDLMNGLKLWSQTA